MRQRRPLAALLAATLVLFLAGCSSDGGEEELLSAADGTVAEDGSSTDGSGERGSGSEGSTVADSPDLVELWSAYLEAYDTLMADGGASPGLDEVATGDAIAALGRRGEQNQELVTSEAYNAIVEVSSTMNLVSVDSGPSPRLRDCTTHTIRTPLGDDAFEVFADHEVRFVPDGEGWRISAVEVLQDGWVGEGFGCVPADYGAEAERVAGVFQDGATRFERDPTEALPPELLAVSSEQLTFALERGRNYLLETGSYSDSPTNVFLDVAGLNFDYAFADGPVVRVNSCVVYPEGQVVRSLETGEVVEETLPPAGTQYFGIDVLVREGFVGEVVASTPLDERC